MLSFKKFFVKHENRIVLFIGVILLCSISYGVGVLKVPPTREAVTIEQKVHAEDFFVKENESLPASALKAVESIQLDNIAENKVSEKENTTVIQPESIIKTGLYVASKNSTKYHLPSCSGAKRIKEENKVWFNSKEEAERAGYEPAKNCKGI